MPDAQSVMVVGDFTQWQEKPVHLQRETGDVWLAMVELTPGRHRYRFIVDGHWCDDPNCAHWVPNPHGSLDSVRHVPAV